MPAWRADRETAMDDLAKGWAILAARGSGHAGADIAIIVATLTSLAIGVVVAMRG